MINRYTVEPTALVWIKKELMKGKKKKPLTVLNIQIQIRVQHALSSLNCDNIYWKGSLFAL